MWFYYALTFALTSSFGVILSKRVMRSINERMFLFINLFFTLPFTLLIVLFFYKVPTVDYLFFISLVISTTIGVIGALLAYKAIKHSEISLISPISSFNPVFTTGISFIVLGETIEKKDLVGIVLVVIGAYLLQISKFKEGIFQPIKALISHKGVQMSLWAYLIWSITPIFERTAISHTDPVVPPFASFVGGFISVPIYAFLVRKNLGEVKSVVKNNLKSFLLIGVLGAVGQAAAFTAFSLTNLGVATAVFKTSMVFTVILGWFIFKEKGIKERLLGSGVMLSGIFILVS